MVIIKTVILYVQLLREIFWICSINCHPIVYVSSLYRFWCFCYQWDIIDFRKVNKERPRKGSLRINAVFGPASYGLVQVDVCYQESLICESDERKKPCAGLFSLLFYYQQNNTCNSGLSMPLTYNFTTSIELLRRIDFVTHFEKAYSFLIS